MPTRTQDIEAQELAAIRADTPGLAQRLHLNNAGCAPPPASVLAAMQAHLELEATLGGYEAGHQEAPAIRAAYDAVGELVGAPAEQVAFVENATVAFAQALSCFDFEAGDVLLTTREDYVSNQLMLLSLAKRRGVRVERVDSTEVGGLDLEDLERRLAAGPKLLAISHIPTNSGLVQPVEAAGALARAAGVPFLLDACQTVGQRPISMESSQADFLCATSRKFLRGPRGMGFLVVARRVLESDLAPLYIDLHGARWVEADRYELAPSAARFENWEFSYALVLGTGEAARYAQAIGIERIQRRTEALAERLRTGLTEQGLRVLDLGHERCGIVTVEIPRSDPAAFHRRLHDAGLNCTPSLRGYGQLDFAAKGVEWALRLSPHYFNTEAEVDRALGTIAEALG